MADSVLAELQSLEQQVVGLVETAGAAFEELSSGQPNPLAFNNHAQRYIQAVMEVNRKLSAHIQRLSGDATFNKSSYGAEKDFELVVWKTDILASQIDAMLEALQGPSVAPGQQIQVPVKAEPLPAMDIDPAT